jgi:hypothetical protein
MIAVNTGYEIQIDDMAAPDGNPLHKIGAIYNFASPSDAAVSKPIGQWNTFEIVPSIKQLVFQTSDTYYSFRYLPMGVSMFVPNNPQASKDVLPLVTAF